MPLREPKLRINSVEFGSNQITVDRVSHLLLDSIAIKTESTTRQLSLPQCLT